MSSPSAFERRGGPAGPTGPTGPAGVPVVTLSGNTTGTMTIISSGTLTLAGGNNITLSQSGNKVTISGANVGGAQTAISGIVGSDATYTSGTVTLTGVGGGITVSSNTGQRIDLSVAAPVAQTNQAGSVYASSNTFGTSSGTYDARTISIAGSGAVSVAASNKGWVINAPAQSVQPETQTFLAGVIASDTTYTSGNVRITGVGGGITVSSNTGQRVDLSVAAPVAQTNQAGSVYASSNTFGTSSGTYDARSISIAGSGIVSIAASNSGFVINASSAAQTNQAGSVYAISNTSGTSSGTYDARTLSIAGAGIVTVAASNSGWRINASQSVQAGSVYASSNTFGTSSGTYDARTLSIAGSGGVSVAASNSGWVISAAAPVAQTNQAGSVYASSNTFGTSSGTYDARSLSIAGSGAVGVAASNSGWVISAPTQTNQAGSVYAASNTSGTSSGTYDARTLSIKGAGLVTVAASNSGWIIDATSAAQTNQAGSVYAISNTSGTSSGTYDARTLSIAGAGIVTVAASNSGWRISASQSVQTQNIMQVTASGNRTSGGGGYVVISTGTMALAGGPNITLSQDANTISVSAGAGGAFSAGMSTEGNTAGNTGVTGSRLVFVGSNNISLSQTTGAAGATLSFNGPASSSLSATGAVSISVNASTISIGAPAQTEQTQSRFNLTLAGNSTSGGAGYIQISSGVMTLAGGNNVTLSQAGNAVTISGANAGGAQTAISGIVGSNATYTSGTVTFTGVGGGVTVSSNTGQRIDISVAAPVAQTNQSGNIYASSNTFGTSSGTYDARSISIAGSGIVSVAASNSGWVISAPSPAAQTNQAQNVFAASNTFGTSSGTADARTLSIAGDGIISVAASNSGWRISATQSTQLGSVYASSNTFGTSSGTYNAKTLSIAGSGAVSVAASDSGWVISAPAQSVQTQNIMQVTASGNRTSGGGGYVVISSGTMALAGGPNITLSQDGNTISISGGAGVGGGGIGAGVSTMGNTAGSTGTVTTGNMYLVGSGPISLSQSTGAAGSNATISINAPATSSLSGAGAITLSTNVSTISISVGPSSSISATGALSLSANGSTISLGVPIITVADWENFPNGLASLMTHVSGFSKTPFYWNNHLDGNIRIKSAAFKISMVTASQPLSVSAHFGVYTFVNSTSANLLGSVSEAYVISSATSVSLSGVRNVVMTGIGTHAALSSLTQGEYMFGMMFSASATNAMNFSLYGAGVGLGQFGGLYPGTNQYSAATNQGIQAMVGRGSTTVNLMPAAVSSADLVMQGQGASQQLQPWIYFRS